MIRFYITGTEVNLRVLLLWHINPVSQFCICNHRIKYCELIRCYEIGGGARSDKLVKCGLL
jgi:hypothetical protein